MVRLSKDCVLGSVGRGVPAGSGLLEYSAIGRINIEAEYSSSFWSVLPKSRLYWDGDGDGVRLMGGVPREWCGGPRLFIGAACVVLLF